MKILSNIRVDFFHYYDKHHSIFLFDVYKHSFTFVYIKNPRTERGITIALIVFRYRLNLAFYIDRPYTIKSNRIKRNQEHLYEKKET